MGTITGRLRLKSHRPAPKRPPQRPKWRRAAAVPLETVGGPVYSRKYGNTLIGQLFHMGQEDTAAKVKARVLGRSKHFGQRIPHREMGDFTRRQKAALWLASGHRALELREEERRRRFQAPN